MFNVGGALNALQNAAGMAGGAVVTPRVGWNDPSSYWTPERLRNQARNNAGVNRNVYQRQQIGGTEAAFTGAGGGGMKVGAGYSETPGMPGSAPRPARSPMAALERQAARGNPGWGVGGYK